MQNVVIIGAGQSGFETAAKLRALEFEGSITIVGEEDQPPYQRPPLSKAYLLGKLELERLFFRPADYYEQNNIDLYLSTRCEGIDRTAKTVTLNNGRSLPYDALVITTGSSPTTAISAGR